MRSSTMSPDSSRRRSRGDGAREHRAHAGQELAQAERLDDVIVGADHQPDDPATSCRARSQHDGNFGFVDDPANDKPSRVGSMTSSRSGRARCHAPASGPRRRHRLDDLVIFLGGCSTSRAGCRLFDEQVSSFGFSSNRRIDAPLQLSANLALAGNSNLNFFKITVCQKTAPAKPAFSPAWRPETFSCAP